ncbi:MAG: potassium/proton antiporter [Succinivibrionaceae bacterium]
MDYLNNTLLIVGILLSSSIFASRISSFMGLPVLLLFLGIGMLCGNEGLFIKIEFDDYNLAFLLSNVALAIILFDGGCQTNIHMFFSSAKQSVLLATVGVIITTAIVGICVHYLIGFSFYESMLIAAIIGSTDAGAVFCLLGSNGISLKNKVNIPLQMESATNDPMAIFLTTTIITIITASESNTDISPLHMLVFFAQQFFFGIAFGILFGIIGKHIINNINIPSGLYSLLIIGIAFIGFSITSSLNGSGFLAIFIMGMIIGNQNTRQVNYIRSVQEGLSWLSQISLFLILGLLVDPKTLVNYIWIGLLVSILMTIIARPIAVFLCLKPFFNFSNKELLFISWVGLRGSVPIVLAIYPIMYNIPHGEIFFNIAFVVVIFSLLIQGATILPIAKFFDVYTPCSVAPITKGQIGISLSDDYEIFNYEIKNHAFDNLTLREIKFPSKTLISSIYRHAQMMKPHSNITLQKGDIISIVGHAEDEPLLNSIFSGNTPIKKVPYFYNGDIILNGNIPMPEISKNYDMIITSLEKELTLSEFMNYQIGGYPQVGDRVTIIDSRLTVFEIQGDIITKIGYEKLESML